jgi:hypothetical protein
LVVFGLLYGEKYPIQLQISLQISLQIPLQNCCKICSGIIYIIILIIIILLVTHPYPSLEGKILLRSTLRPYIKTIQNPEIMEKQNSNLWSKILKITITVLSAIAAAFGIQACC